MFYLCFITLANTFEQIGNINKYSPSAMQQSYDSIFTELTGAWGFRYDIMESGATSKPTDAVTICFTIKRVAPTITLGTQFVISVQGAMFIRSYNGNTWGNWSVIS